MGTRDKRVDAYIAKSADFAQPILTHLRELVHEACPEVEETMKWSFPNFVYKGILCSMAAFKQHCSFGFWKASLVLGEEAVESKESMGSFGRLTSIKDLPSKRLLVSYIKKAKQLNEDGIQPKKAAATKQTKKDLSVPDYFLGALKTNKSAKSNFDAFPYSKQKDYVEWITEAKTEATRTRRIETSLAWISEGKARNWKYEK
jgi:uncharacterized protein YdeI (YjbR/CyaY-like superfamily)